jgi:uncharacterized membrane protein
LCFALVGLGILLILLGVYLSLQDWQRKRNAKLQAKEPLGEEFEGLAKLADALKSYPLGMQLIVWGIVIILVGALFGGVGGLTASC